MWGSKKHRQIKDLEIDLSAATKDAKFWSTRNAEKREKIKELSAKLAKVSQQYIEAGQKLNAALATVQSQQEEIDAIQAYYYDLEVENSALQIIVDILLTDFQ